MVVCVIIGKKTVKFMRFALIVKLTALEAILKTIVGINFAEITQRQFYVQGGQ
jgi:hypothetical protein